MCINEGNDYELSRCATSKPGLSQSLQRSKLRVLRVMMRVESGEP